MEAFVCRTLYVSCSLDTVLRRTNSVRTGYRKTDSEDVIMTSDNIFLRTDVGRRCHTLVHFLGIGSCLGIFR